MKTKEFIEQLAELVSFETLTGNFNEAKRALDYVASKLDSQAKITRKTNNGYELLIASNKTTKMPDVAFLVHMDVVSGKPEQFKIVEDGDTLRGRGVSDMKFSVPMGIALLNKVIKEKLDLSFALIITTDEETGGFSGAYFLANEFGLKPKCLIVPDGGDNLTFVNKAKGVCQLELTAFGKPAHSSRPWDGKNALNQLIKVASVLLKKYERNSFNPNWNTTLNIGQIEGGISTNQLCPKATMKVDFRFPENTSFEEIKCEVEEIAEKVDPDIQVKQLSFGMPTFTDVNDSLVKKFIASMQSEITQKIEIKETYGASDARHFAKLNVPVFMIKPLGGAIHTDDEWISVKSCIEFYKGLEKFVDIYDKN